MLVYKGAGTLSDEQGISRDVCMAVVDEVNASKMISV